jgi:hypothetical protein
MNHDRNGDRMTFPGRWITALLIPAILMAPSPVVAGDRYQEVWQQSIEIEKAGNPADAALLLESLRPDFAQDYLLHLRLGWLYFSAHDWIPATTRYETSLSLNPDSTEARLGLGWSVYYRGLTRVARKHFQTVLETIPDHPSALQGVALTRSGTSIGATVTSSVHSYQGHPWKTSAYSTSVTIPATIANRVRLGGTYRFTRFNVLANTGAPGNWGQETFTQHEGHIQAGLFFPAGGAAVHYSLLSHNATGSSDNTHIAGISGRLKAWGTLSIEGTVGLYSTTEVYQSRLQYRIPLGDLAIVPGGNWQYSSGEHYGAGSLSFQWSKSRFFAEAGGRYGLQYRPVYLDQAVVYNITDTVQGSAWALLQVALKKGFYAMALYEYHRLQSKGSDTPVDSDMHVGLAGIGWRFSK